MILHVYTPTRAAEVPRGCAIVGLPGPTGRVIAVIDTDGKAYRNRATRAAIRFCRARGAKTSLRRFAPEQLHLVATYDTDAWSFAQVHDYDTLEAWCADELSSNQSPACMPLRRWNGSAMRASG